MIWKMIVGLISLFFKSFSNYFFSIRSWLLHRLISFVYIALTNSAHVWSGKVVTPRLACPGPCSPVLWRWFSAYSSPHPVGFTVHQDQKQWKDAQERGWHACNQPPKLWTSKKLRVGAKSSNTSQHISSNYSCYLSSNPPAGSSQTRSNISAKTFTLTPASCITRTMPGSNTNLETGKRREGWRAGDDWLMERFIWKYIVMGCYGYIFSKNWE